MEIYYKAAGIIDSAAAWDVMDELMDMLKAVNARVYESVLRKMKQL